LNSIGLTTGADDLVTVKDRDDCEKYNAWQQTLEITSCFLSISCVLGVIDVWVVQKSITIESLPGT